MDRASDQLVFDLREALIILRQRELDNLERTICCKFTMEARDWNEYVISMYGTENGVRKGRRQLLRKVAREPSPANEMALMPLSNDPTAIARGYAQLPKEIKQMIVHRVLWSSSEPHDGDGRRVLALRGVSRHFKDMAEREIIQNKGRCFKRVIFIVENSGNTVRLGFSPIDAKVSVSFEQLDHLLAMIDCSAAAAARFHGSNIRKTPVHTEVYIQCEFRRAWCHDIMSLLLKHPHIQPEILKVRGVLCDGNIFQRYVKERPSLKHIFFEKPLCEPNFFRHQFFPFRTYAFSNLGPQDRSPENVRNSYSIYHGYHRDEKTVPRPYALAANELIANS